MKFSEWTDCRSLTDAQVAALLEKKAERTVSRAAVGHWRTGARKPNAANRVAIQKITRGKVRLADWDDE